MLDPHLLVLAVLAGLWVIDLLLRAFERDRTPGTGSASGPSARSD
jgi:hypothetical protein